MAKKKILAIILALILVVTGAVLMYALSCCHQDNDSSSSSNSSSSTQSAMISAESIELILGEQTTLTVSGVEGSVEWSTRDTAVATVENGIVTALGRGETWIIASTENGDLYCRVTVTIANVALPVIRLDGEIEYAGGYSLNVLVGEKYTLHPILVVGEEKPETSFTLTASGGINVEGLSFTTTAPIANGTLTVSCEYNGNLCTLEISISASEGV
jgi:hypothetical protein